jgi:SAM-dependent methyltransferase
MHDLSCFPDQAFAVVYSSHTIEHAYYPKQMIAELIRVLQKDGELIVVLPYPDETAKNDLAHGAKYELGTNIDDGGRTVVSVFESLGLQLKTQAFDDFREPEIWLTFAKAR